MDAGTQKVSPSRRVLPLMCSPCLTVFIKYQKMKEINGNACKGQHFKVAIYLNLFEQQFRTHPVVKLSWSSRLNKRIRLHSQNTQLHISICATVFIKKKKKPRRRIRYAILRKKTYARILFIFFFYTHNRKKNHLFCDLHRMDFNMIKYMWYIWSIHMLWIQILCMYLNPKHVLESTCVLTLSVLLQWATTGVEGAAERGVCRGQAKNSTTLKTYIELWAYENMVLGPGQDFLVCNPAQGPYVSDELSWIFGSNDAPQQR